MRSLRSRIISFFIVRASEREINEIIRALIIWQEKKFPEYELIVLSLPKYDQIVRRNTLERFTEFMGSIEHKPVHKIR